MPKASARVPRLPELARSSLPWSLEKSMWTRSNIARASTTKSTAMPTLNQIVLLIAPKVAAVSVTVRPITP